MKGVSKRGTMGKSKDLDYFQPSQFSNEILLRLLRESVFDLYQCGVVDLRETYQQCCMIQEEILKRLKTGSNATDGRRSASRG